MMNLSIQNCSSSFTSSRLIRSLLPQGGYVCQMIEAYFDESGSHAGSPVLCVAGLLLESEAAVRLSEEWAAMLQKYDLPFFHTVDCAHGRKPFDRLGSEGCIEVQSEAIHLVREYITCAFAATVEPEQFHRIIPQGSYIGTPYTMCVHNCVTGVGSWAQSVGYDGDIAYFFESGHESQGEANGVMNRIFSTPEIRKFHRYSSHSFADKKKMLPLQAADLIAWHWYSEGKRMSEGKRPNLRLDSSALFKPNEMGKLVRFVHFSEENLRELALALKLQMGDNRGGE